MTLRVVPNPSAIVALLNSDEVAAKCLAHGERIAAAAGDGFVAERLDAARTRARVQVRTDTIDAMLAEANDRALTNALDAGRG